MAEIVLVRHGQTEWSATGRHTSYTDLPLTPDGERQARSLAPVLVERDFAAVLTSPRHGPSKYRRSSSAPEANTAPRNSTQGDH